MAFLKKSFFCKIIAALVTITFLHLQIVWALGEPLSVAEPKEPEGISPEAFINSEEQKQEDADLKNEIENRSGAIPETRQRIERIGNDAYYYDEKDQIFCHKQYDPSGGIILEEQYRYDNDRNLKEKDVIYYEAGKITEVNHFNGGNELITREQYQYNEDSLKEKKITDDQGILLESVSYEKEKEVLNETKTLYKNGQKDKVYRNNNIIEAYSYPAEDGHSFMDVENFGENSISRYENGRLMSVDKKDGYLTTFTYGENGKCLVKVLLQSKSLTDGRILEFTEQGEFKLIFDGDIIFSDDLTVKERAEILKPIEEEIFITLYDEYGELAYLSKGQASKLEIA